MSWNNTICGKCLYTQEFYERYVPPCPKCGYPAMYDTSEAWCESLGVKVKPKKADTIDKQVKKKG